MSQRKVISADSHVVEPKHLWVERADRRFRDRVPRIDVGAAGIEVFVVPNGPEPPTPVGMFGAAGMNDDELKTQGGRGYAGLPESCWDPHARLEAQDVDGIAAEVVYPTQGMKVYGIEDPDLQRECIRVYNDWLAEFCSAHPDRLVGVGMISLQDVPLAVDELERCAELGLKGAMIWSSPPADRPYSSTLYDPFWEAASHLGVPLSMHCVTGRSKESTIDPARLAQTGALIIHEVQRTIGDLVCNGVLERFPALRFVSVENDVGWMANLVRRFDHYYEKFGVLVQNRLPLLPSEYIRRQVFATFQDDPIGPLTWKIFGEDNYCWASDFPHPDSTWPSSHKIIERDFATVPTTVTRKIVCDNVTTLYQLDQV